MENVYGKLLLKHHALKMVISIKKTKMLKITRKYLPKKRTFTSIIYENVPDHKTCIQISL